MRCFLMGKVHIIKIHEIFAYGNVHHITKIHEMFLYGDVHHITKIHEMFLYGKAQYIILLKFTRCFLMEKYSTL